MYRKFSGDGLFTGYQMLDNGFVLITTGEGKVVDIVSTSEAGDNIERLEGILCPGFINAHCHLELSHMKGRIPEKTGLVDFALQVIFERHAELEAIAAAIETAEDEMLQNGIVGVGDICNTTYTIPQKKKQRLHYHNFIEALGFVPADAGKRFKQSIETFHAFKTLTSPASIVPHAPYSVSKELFQLINDFPGNGMLTIHNQESIAENKLFQKKEGDLLRLYEKMNIDITSFKPSGHTGLQTFLPWLNHHRSLILVHNVYASKEDIQFEQQQTSHLEPQTSSLKPQTYYCLCPNANLYISGQLPNVNLLLQEQCTIVLGTDSVASNHQLSILEEIKTLNRNFPQLKVEMLLQWATLNGARALGIDEKLGSFQAGKKPGIVLLEKTTDKIITASSKERKIF